MIAFWGILVAVLLVLLILAFMVLLQKRHRPVETEIVVVENRDWPWWWRDSAGPFGWRGDYLPWGYSGGGGGWSGNTVISGGGGHHRPRHHPGGGRGGGGGGSGHGGRR
jgi:hypothetical protein